MNDTLSSFPTRPISPQPAYEALTAAGLLSKSPAPNGTDVIYSLTGEGRKSQFKPVDGEPNPNPPVFCGGVLKVDQIVNFTEPAESGGVRETQVVYTTKIVDVPRWVSNPAVKISFPNWTPVAQQDPVRAKAVLARRQQETLKLTNKGWRVDGDM